jgi:hypothetical protein
MVRRGPAAALRTRLHPNTGALGRHEGFGVAGESPAIRPSVSGDMVLGGSNNATAGINAN